VVTVAGMVETVSAPVVVTEAASAVSMTRSRGGGGRGGSDT
jgi:hypothetical protein